MATIGQILGVIEHVFDVTNSAGDTVRIKAKFDCTSATDAQIAGYVIGNRTIALQRPLKALTLDELKALGVVEVAIEHAGNKIESKSKKIEKAKKMLEWAKKNNIDLNKVE